mmetsp:Transcript_42366/g.128059  ORF Transcript_42366/g.128059 Transcript_42366/m.128059 type:complete len:387 (+) Transcript_42366:559-1719(+)
MRPLLTQVAATKKPISPRPTMAKPTCTVLFKWPGVHIGAATIPDTNLPTIAASVRTVTSAKLEDIMAWTGTWKPTEQAKKIRTSQPTAKGDLSSHLPTNGAHAVATKPAMKAPSNSVECIASAPQLSVKPRPSASKMATELAQCAFAKPLQNADAPPPVCSPTGGLVSRPPAASSAVSASGSARHAPTQDGTGSPRLSPASESTGWASFTPPREERREQRRTDKRPPCLKARAAAARMATPNAKMPTDATNGRASCQAPGPPPPPDFIEVSTDKATKDRTSSIIAADTTNRPMGVVRMFASVISCMMKPMAVEDSTIPQAMLSIMGYPKSTIAQPTTMIGAISPVDPKTNARTPVRLSSAKSIDTPPSKTASSRPSLPITCRPWSR